MSLNSELSFSVIIISKHKIIFQKCSFFSFTFRALNKVHNAILKTNKNESFKKFKKVLQKTSKKKKKIFSGNIKFLAKISYFTLNIRKLV